MKSFEQPASQELNFDMMQIGELEAYMGKVLDINLGKEIEGEIFGTEAIPVRDAFVDSVRGYNELAGKGSTSQEDIDAAIEDVRAKAKALHDMEPALQEQKDAIAAKVMAAMGFDKNGNFV